MVDVARGATIYLDTNALIYMAEGSAAFKRRLEKFFEQAVDAAARLVTSELALTEALVHPIRDNNKKLLEAYNDLFEHFVDARPITRRMLIRAAELRAGPRKYRTPDAIHIATAEDAGAQLFATGDSGIEIVLPMRRYLLLEAG